MPDSDLPTAPIVPQARLALVVLPFLVALDILAYCMSGQQLQGFLTPAGLLLTTVGAVVLSLPDVPLLWQYTHAGRLGQGQDSFTVFMSSNFLLKPEEDGENWGSERYHYGFYEILDTLRAYHHNRWFGPVQAKPSEEKQWLETELIQKEIRDNVLDNQEEVLVGYETTSDSSPETFDYELRWVNKILDEAQQIQVSRMRRLGILLIILGFLQQLVIHLPIWD